MPELPEVETLRKGLQPILLDQVVEAVAVQNRNLRFPLPRGFAKKLVGQRVVSVERRAKYLLLKTSGPTLLNHLGMTGAWRVLGKGGERKHDHVLLQLSCGRILVYNDPRRFGYFDLLESGREQQSRWLSHLGPEPLDLEGFTGEYLRLKTRKRVTKVKTLLMDQKVVVGVGNIYASEALFLAGIRPTRLAKSLRVYECETLVQSIRQVLAQAIRAGGTTIRDFRQAGGSKGDFQNELKVYGRENSPCHNCGRGIKTETFNGRSSFWCSSCQH
jgi:formamidopyrimidine-DNA glycosylase